MAEYELVAVARTPQASGPPLLEEIGPIVAPSITWKREIAAAGGLSFSCSPDTLAEDVRQRLRDPLGKPTEVALYRDGQPWMRAFVAGYQMQGEGQQTLSVTAPGLLDYLRYMWIVSDLSFSGVEQTAIAKQLVDQWQSLSYGHYGIDTSAITPSGVLRDRIYKAAEQHQVHQRLLELGAVDNGFDVDVDPATRQLVLAYPKLGADLSSSVFLDGRNITDPGVVVSVAPGDVASEAFGVGGDGTTAITATAFNASVRSTWGRAGVSQSFDGVTIQSTLDGHTQALLDARGKALFTPGPGLHPVRDAEVGAFDIGDVVTYEYDAGLGVQSGAYRVAALEVTVDQDGLESMAVSFA